MRVVLGHLRHHPLDPPAPRPPTTHPGSGNAAIRPGGPGRDRLQHYQSLSKSQ